MYQSYDEYLASQVPKYHHTCPCCGRTYYSDDGNAWEGDDWDGNHDPVQGAECVVCEADRAKRDVHHWASQDVLNDQKTMEEIFHDALEWIEGDDRERATVRLRILNLLLQEPDFLAAAEAHLWDHESDLIQRIDDAW